jgi:hypothetical protein
MKRLGAILAFLAVAMMLIPATAFSQVPSNPLRNVPVTGELEDGRAFTGTLSIDEINLAEDGQSLLASGVLRGTVEGERGQIRQVFEDVPLDLLPGVGAFQPPGQRPPQQPPQECPILVLELGPIFLDLLGLQVFLDEVLLEITAVAGPGNLLGNLLCALVGLLDPPFLALPGIETILQSILNAINQLL